MQTKKQAVPISAIFDAIDRSAEPSSAKVETTLRKVARSVDPTITKRSLYLTNETVVRMRQFILDREGLEDLNLSTLAERAIIQFLDSQEPSKLRGE